MCFEQIGCEGLDWIDVAQDTVQLRAMVDICF
jgi:hypothetical protein